MRKKLGEKFGVVFSFAVVVMDTEDGRKTWIVNSHIDLETYYYVY